MSLAVVGSLTFLAIAGLLVLAYHAERWLDRDRRRRHGRTP